MATEHILTLLIQERDKLNRVIAALGEPAKRAGLGAPSAAGSGAGRRKRTAAEKKAQSLRMKAYWAKRRKDAAK